MSNSITLPADAFSHSTDEVQVWNIGTKHANTGLLSFGASECESAAGRLLSFSKREEKWVAVSLKAMVGARQYYSWMEHALRYDGDHQTRKRYFWYQSRVRKECPEFPTELMRRIISCMPEIGSGLRRLGSLIQIIQRGDDIFIAPTPKMVAGLATKEGFLC